MSQGVWGASVLDRYHADVVVCGGGPAGFAAAVRAAREGARVLLLERLGYLGGNLTGSMVNPMMTFHGPDGTQLVRGIPQELVERLVTAGGSPGHVPDPVQFVATVTPFDVELWKYVAEEMLLESGAQPLYHAPIAAVRAEDGQLRSVAIVTKQGLEGVTGRIFIDATGDGIVGALAGEEVAVGRPSDGLTQPMTLVFRMDGVDWTQILNYMQAHPDEFYPAGAHERVRRLPVMGASGFLSLVAAAVQEGVLPPVRDRILFFGTGRPGEAILNVTRVLQHLALDISEWSAAETEGRRQMWQFVRFLQQRVPGFSKARLIGAAAQVGVRETRRVMGEYVLSAEDIAAGTRFPDWIAAGAYPVDIHSPDGSRLQIESSPIGSYTIPLRALLPRRMNNLLVVGRCLSSTHEGLAAVRVSPLAMATGEAAGLLAALAVKTGQQVRQIPVLELQKRLDLPFKVS